MPATTLAADTHLLDTPAGRRLLVAWQHPATRAYALVGVLDLPSPSEDSYVFRYLPDAAAVEGFRPFVEMPDLHCVYRSVELFRLFHNRMTPRERADYPSLAAAVGLDVGADPFEVLVRTGGRRATDTLEVLDMPAVEPQTGTVTTEFLAHGIRHLLYAQSALDRLAPGDLLRVLPDVQNSKDPLSIVLADDQTCNVGWVPRYLSPLLHRSAADFGWGEVRVTVAHVGDPAGPPHLRLLCRVTARWDPEVPVLDVLGSLVGSR